MRIGQIKVGKTYETKVGEGVCTSSGGTFPPSVQVRIEKPFPRGVVTLVPRDVLREVPEQQ